MYINSRNLLNNMYIEGALVSKSCSIVLTIYHPLYFCLSLPCASNHTRIVLDSASTLLPLRPSVPHQPLLLPDQWSWRSTPRRELIPPIRSSWNINPKSWRDGKKESRYLLFALNCCMRISDNVQTTLSKKLPVTSKSPIFPEMFSYM